MSVYFIACGGFIKVGFSEDPERRVANLFRSGSRYSAPRAAYEARGTQQLIGFVAGTKTTERAMHLALEDFAAGCEWFVDEPAVREFAATCTPEEEDYPKVTRLGGPVEVPHCESGGGNVELALDLLARRSA